MCKNLLSEVQYEVTVPSLEDKILQRATVQLLNAVYETDFLACSPSARAAKDHTPLGRVGEVHLRTRCVNRARRGL